MTEHPSVYTFVASTSRQSRDGTTIDQAGWDLANYHKNPVVLLNHSWFSPPVGKSLKTWVEADRLMARLQFADTQLGRELALLTADGYLRALSVGFRPTEFEISRDKQGFPTGLHSHKQELLEISVVALPANPDALRQGLELAVAQQVLFPSGFVWTTPAEDPPTPGTPAETDLAQITHIFQRINQALREA